MSYVIKPKLVHCPIHVPFSALKTRDVANIPSLFDGRRYATIFDELAVRKAKDHTDSTEFPLVGLNMSLKVSRTLHFAFVGDSRLRQLFAAFMAVSNQHTLKSSLMKI